MRSKPARLNSHSTQEKTQSAADISNAIMRYKLSTQMMANAITLVMKMRREFWELPIVDQNAQLDMLTWATTTPIAMRSANKIDKFLMVIIVDLSVEVISL
jgi:hypothetical protein